MNVTQSWKRLVRSGALAGAILIAPVAAFADEEFYVESAQGEIESVDIATNEIVAGGIRYTVAYDADVEIGGNYAAFTMLSPGLKVDMKVHRYPDNRLEVVSVKELPAGREMKQY